MIPVYNQQVPSYQYGYAPNNTYQVPSYQYGYAPNNTYQVPQQNISYQQMAPVYQQPIYQQQTFYPQQPQLEVVPEYHHINENENHYTNYYKKYF